jgi:hypothetical protein
MLSDAEHLAGKTGRTARQMANAADAIAIRALCAKANLAHI